MSVYRIPNQWCDIVQGAKVMWSGLLASAHSIFEDSTLEGILALINTLWMGHGDVDNSLHFFAA